MGPAGWWLYYAIVFRYLLPVGFNPFTQCCRYIYYYLVFVQAMPGYTYCFIHSV